MKNYKIAMRYAAHAFGRGVRVMASLDIEKARTEAQNVRKRLDESRDKLAEMQLSGTAKDEDMKKVRDGIVRDAQRYDDLMRAVRAAEGDQADRVAEQFNRKLDNRVANRKAALGSLYRSLLSGAPFEPSARAELSLPISNPPADGPYLLPKNVSDEILHDIFSDGSILQEITMTQITGLSYPKVNTTRTGDYEDAPEGSDPNELKMEGGELMFGRYPYASYIEVPTALLSITNTDLEAMIDEDLRVDAQDFVCSRLFKAGASGDHAHMSVYDDTIVKIKEVTADDELTGIIDALADLPTKVRRVAKVTLTPVKWLRMVRDLANGAQTLFGRPDEGVLGFTPVLCDYATQTLVGDLKTIHCNWDMPLGFEKERSAKKRLTTAVISGYYDIHIKNPARLRRVKASVDGYSLSPNSGTGVKISAVEAGAMADAVAAINNLAGALVASRGAETPAQADTGAANKAAAKSTKQAAADA